MAKQSINVGTAANDKKGDSLRAAFQKVNANFTELYVALGLDSGGLNLGAFEFTGSTLSTTDSSSIIIDQATTITSNLTVGGDLLPSVANGGDLGSSALPWRSLYVSNNTIYIGGTAVGVDANGALTTGGTVVGSTPAWANITGKPTIPTSFDRLVNGDYELVVETDGIISSVAFPERDGGKIYLSGVEIGSIPSDPEDTFPTPLVLTSQQGNIRITPNAIQAPRLDWEFGADGTLSYPKSALQRDTATVACLGNASTVVFTASGVSVHTIRLLIQVEGTVGAAVDMDTQACEMIIAKSFRADAIAASVYGVVHTSVAPLATFTANWNALTSRVEVLCTAPSANTVNVRIFATEITTSD